MKTTINSAINKKGSTQALTIAPQEQPSYSRELVAALTSVNKRPVIEAMVQSKSKSNSRSDSNKSTARQDSCPPPGYLNDPVIIPQMVTPGKKSQKAVKMATNVSKTTTLNTLLVRSKTKEGQWRSKDSVLSPSLEDTEVLMYCDACDRSVLSQPRTTAGRCSWISCVLFCAFGLFCGCCLLPFQLDCFKDIEHHCPRCDGTLSRVDRAEAVCCRCNYRSCCDSQESSSCPCGCWQALFDERKTS